ncbi:Poly [ADP-ribose] polymerase 1 [Clonorchis sinensis]|uniref:Poly [ADP-ribose] polymerase n=1 Tax=Clonorchis sinensis TaxID=79923 RepID=A0A8T1N3F1_CLOSI|nr:Poly [ADP-ribose] polymerase 1 [Clonorchis sinensis]
MEVDYQYQVDYAKSGRAGCTKCKTPIPQDSLRVARLIQASNFDGKIPKWFHFRCFFTGKIKIQATSEIKNFDSLRWEDQEKIRSALGSSDGITTPPTTLKFSIKLALPGLNCTTCKGVLLQERHMIHEGDKESTVDYHLSCFLRSNHCPEDITTLAGFKKLKQVDRDAVTLAHTEATKENLKRARPAEANDKGPAAKKTKVDKPAADDEQNALRHQSNRLWKLRGNLEREVSKDALIGLLEYNGQHVPSGLSNLLEAVSDAMVFGALLDCPSCKNGPLHYSNGQYKCTAMATEWAKCLFTTRDPERKPFLVPKEYFDVEFLKNYKYVKRKRLFAKDSAPPPVRALSTHTIFVTDGPHDDGKSKAALVDECKALGASVTEKLGSGVILVSSPMGLENMDKKDKTRAKSLGLRIVDQKVLSTLKKSSVKLSTSQLTAVLEKHTISDWTVKPLLEKVESKGSSSAFNARDADDVIKCTFKGGAVVDPESGLESRASVMKDSLGKPMSAVLGMVDLVKGSNSFYRLQALQADTKASFWVFRAWGRIGTTIGGTKLEKFTTASAARQSFEDLYLEKTGNEWKDRANFQKKPHKFYEMELDYGEAEEKGQQVVPTRPSKLHPALQALVQFICDIESMKEAMIEFELDLRKMPLGKLSKRQIHEAFGVLSSLSALLDKKKKKSTTNLDPTFLLSASTRFYTLIPHNFGMKAPPLLDNPKMIRDKLKMLDDLLEIELAYNILKEDKQSGEHPLDQHYKQLKTNLKLLDPSEEEYKRIAEYIQLTHGATHRHFSLQLEAVFDVERPEEKAHFDNYKPAQHNKQLLWHGSRRTNWVGILSQGLRIAPPEAPVTGYMFGKGIYFADVVSKAANYCFTNQSQPYGIMLLCEVILGDMDKCIHANGDPLPSQYHSRMGVGSVTPDPKSHYTNPEGVVYPIGVPIDSGVKNGSLIYNEYIVYDVAQVKQKYLVRVKFTY